MQNYNVYNFCYQVNSKGLGACPKFDIVTACVIDFKFHCAVQKQCPSGRFSVIDIFVYIYKITKKDHLNNLIINTRIEILTDLNYKVLGM